MYFTDQLKVNEGSCGFDRSDPKKRRFRNAPLVMYFGILQGGQLYHRWEGGGGVQINVLNGHVFTRVAPQLLTTSNFIGPWYHAALLFLGLGSVVLLFGVLFFQQIRKDLVRAATSPLSKGILVANFCN